MPKQYSVFNYRRNLVVMLIFLQLLTVTSILLLTRVSTDRIMIGNAYETIAKTIHRSAEHTSSFLKPAYNVSQTLALLADNSIINFNDIETVEKLFFTKLTNNKNFAGISIANDDGNFIYMLRQAQQTDISDKPLEAYHTKIITPDSTTPDVTFHWRKANFEIIRKEPINDYVFDPRVRPWYQLASNSNQTVWTEPYTFFTSKKLGITVATPFQNKSNNTSGVIGIDIEIDQLSSFLDSIQNNNHIRILDNNQNLIADSDSLNVLSNEKINQLLQTKNGPSDKKQGTFEEKKHEYLFVQSYLKSNTSEPDWKIFAYAKTSPFLKKARSLELRNIFIALMTLVISILISILIAKKTSKPVESWMNQASTDNLTQLYNRHFFFSTANKRYSEYIELPDHNLAVMMIDVDLFKRINDDYGHNIGDKVLRGISDSISSIIKPDDLLARFGGEEFILLTKVDSHRDAMQFAEKIREVIANLNINTDVGIINITISIGVSVTEKQLKLSFREFIDLADKALYHSKNNGRNNVSLAKDNEIHSNKDTIKAR